VKKIENFIDSPEWWTLEIPQQLLKSSLIKKTDGSELYRINIPCFILPPANDSIAIINLIEKTNYFQKLKDKKNRKVVVNTKIHKIRIK
jgi:hypothetical protein